MVVMYLQYICVLMMKITRASVAAMDDILGEKFAVLDKGFVRVIDYMGCDEAIVQAARVSYGDGTKTKRQDEALINYLVKYKHTSPLEMCEVKFHIKLPIFIARQWIRHRTANVNEVSARYSILPQDFYIPSPQNISVQSTDNKQGRGKTLSPEQAQKVMQILQQDAQTCYQNYEDMINSHNLARELARINLTLNFYTEWYWKIDLHNLLHFLNLRLHPHAQYEIREYAQIMFKIVQKWCPFAAGAFSKHIIGSSVISTTANALLKDIAKNGLQSQWFESFTSNLDENLQKYSLSKREYEELMYLLV